jgi:large subunit ribosomal protein L33
VTKQLKTVFVKLLSTANTGYTYFTRKNPSKLTHKLFFRKFDPIIRQHVIFEERKK